MTQKKERGLPGRGPWRILPECPSLMHNTRHAAGLGPKKLRCICPRGVEQQKRFLELQEKNRLEKIVAAAANAAEPSKEGRGFLPSYLTTIRPSMRPVNLAGRGLCRTPWGMEIADAMLSRRNGSAAAHRIMCDECPVRQACLKDVTERESPAGSWGGMYGGLDSAQRARAARNREGANNE